jgi:hypothetical protein
VAACSWLAHFNSPAELRSPKGILMMIIRRVVTVPSPYDPDGFELQNYLFRAYCATVNDFTGDHTRLTLRPCNGNTADTYLQDWELG